MRYRDILKGITVTGILAAGVATGWGVNNRFASLKKTAQETTQRAPQADMSPLPIIYVYETQAQHPHTHYSATALRKAATEKAEAAFAHAKESGLLPVMLEVSKSTKIPMADLMSLTCFESNMGKDLHVKTAKGSPHQTASGIIQIKNDVFVYLAAKHAQELKDQIKRHGGIAGREMLQALFPTARAAEVAAETTPFNRMAKIQTNPRIERAVLSGRDSPYVSMELSSKDLMLVRQDVDPQMRKKMGGALFRMLHMFGLEGTKRILFLDKTQPHANMAEAFKLEGLPSYDPRWYVLKNNRIDPAMSVSAFVQKSQVEYNAVRSTLAALYKADTRLASAARPHKNPRAHGHDFVS